MPLHLLRGERIGVEGNNESIADGGIKDAILLRGERIGVEGNFISAVDKTTPLTC